MTEIIVALVGGGCGIVSAIVSAKMMSKKVTSEVQQQLVVAQAITDTKLDELTREVREHNNFAKRMPVVENEIDHIEKSISILQKYHSN